ncbi:glycoside hydrolase family 3 protein [Cryobacterium luteum]|uniref:beta-N-acetylhexosaminidase n=2 Tax=Cryobacterium luteum TaxID=1424661 RepID=A0A5F0D0J8_9MICO|nr:glycoside hydrolase family 3 protein [Cryobacterium luteum]
MGVSARRQRTIIGATLIAALLTGCVPQPSASEVYAQARLETMSLPDKVASLLMLHSPGTDAAQLRTFVDDYHLGGLILMGDNIPGSVTELATMTAALSAEPGLPLLIGIDQEGGAVSRLPGDIWPGGERLRRMPLAATSSAFHQRALLLDQAGINVNFGIVADIVAEPDAFLFDRALGSDPTAAADRVTAAVAAQSEAAQGSVASTIKHFPGHGAAAGDSHVSLPSSDLSLKAWTKSVAPPFTAGIDAGAELIMVGHLAYPAVDSQPATLSARWYDILRTDLGFDGVSITDDLLMLGHSGLEQYYDPIENGIAALSAGATMLLFVLPAQPDTVGVNVSELIIRVCAAVADGRIDANDVDENVLRVLTLRRDLATGPG